MIRAMSSACLCLVSLAFGLWESPFPSGEAGGPPEGSGFGVLVGSCKGSKHEKKKDNINFCSRKGKRASNKCKAKEEKLEVAGFKIPVRYPVGCEKDEFLDSCPVHTDQVLVGDGKQTSTATPCDTYQGGPCDEGVATKLKDFYEKNPPTFLPKTRDALRAFIIALGAAADHLATPCSAGTPNENAYCPDGAETEETAQKYHTVMPLKCGP